jgi:hypothetical protein
LHLVVLVRLRPSNFVIDMGGLKDEHEIQRPETVGAKVDQEDAQKTGMENVIWYANTKRKVAYLKDKYQYPCIFIT